MLVMLIQTVSEVMKVYVTVRFLEIKPVKGIDHFDLKSHITLLLATTWGKDNGIGKKGNNICEL